MERGGISTVIATVLTVLITIAAVVILWTSVQPLLTRAEFSTVPLTKFEIDKAGSFTFYDPETGYLSTRITRGNDNDDPMVVALKFVIDIEGTSVSRKTYNVMPPNHALVYYFIVGFHLEIDSVKVIPIYLINGEEREGETFGLETRIPIYPGALLEKVGEVPIVPAWEDSVTDGLVLYYSFDEQFVSGATIMDQSGAGHAGDLFGSIEFLESDDRAYATFDGSGNYITSGDGQGLAEETAGDKTIAFWVIFDCPIDLSHSNQALFGSYENYIISFLDPCHTFVDSEVRVSYDAYPIDPRSIASVNGWNDLTGWEFIATSFDSANGVIRLYRNGELVDTHTGLLISSSDPNPYFYVGTVAEAPTGGADPTSFFQGGLDELRVYDRVLDAAEILALYEYSS